MVEMMIRRKPNITHDVVSSLSPQHAVANPLSHRGSWTALSDGILHKLAPNLTCLYTILGMLTLAEFHANKRLLCNILYRVVCQAPQESKIAMR